MIGTRRLRVELAGDTAELHRYLAELHGLRPGKHITRVLALYADTAEKENPSLRAHMLAWRAARSAANLADADADAVPF
jgi:hypothetical protein